MSMSQFPLAVSDGKHSPFKPNYYSCLYRCCLSSTKKTVTIRDIHSDTVETIKMKTFEDNGPFYSCTVLSCLSLE